MSLTTEQYLELDRKSIWHPFTRHSALQEEQFPVISSGQDVWLWDNDGNRYLDAVSSWWCCNLGHGHPHLLAALREQSEKLQHSMLGNMSHPPAVNLASRLIKLFPDEERRVLFASDGTCAVEAALRVAIQYWYNIGQPEKCRFAALKEGYHGDTLGTIALGFIPRFHEPYRSVLQPVYHIERPYCAACQWDQEPDSCQRECLTDLRQVLEQHHRELAALIVEPHCQAAAGMRIYSPQCLREMAELCKQYEVLLIVDEIAVGMGRTGRMFSFEHAGIDPDIVCLGKGLAGGYLPVSASVVRESIFDTFTDKPHDNTLYHGHTFAGNPLGTAVANACLDVYEQQGIVQETQRKAGILAREMENFKSIEWIKDIRSFGMIAAFDIDDSNDGTPGAVIAQQIRRKLLAEGILLRPLGSVLYLMFPLVIDEELMIQTTRAIYQTLARESAI